MFIKNLLYAITSNTLRKWQGIFSFYFVLSLIFLLLLIYSINPILEYYKRLHLKKSTIILFIIILLSASLFRISIFLPYRDPANPANHYELTALKLLDKEIYPISNGYNYPFDLSIIYYLTRTHNFERARLVGSLFVLVLSIFAIIVIFLLTLAFFKNELTALTTTLFFSFSPFVIHIFLRETYFNMSFLLSVLSLLFLIIGLERKDNIILVLSVITLSMANHTHAESFTILALFLCFSVFYVYKKKINWSVFFANVGLYLIFISPLILPVIDHLNMKYLDLNSYITTKFVHEHTRSLLTTFFRLGPLSYILILLTVFSIVYSIVREKRFIERKIFILIYIISFSLFYIYSFFGHQYYVLYYTFTFFLFLGIQGGVEALFLLRNIELKNKLIHDKKAAKKVSLLLTLSRIIIILLFITGFFYECRMTRDEVTFGHYFAHHEVIIKELMKKLPSDVVVVTALPRFFEYYCYDKNCSEFPYFFNYNELYDVVREEYAVCIKYKNYSCGYPSFSDYGINKSIEDDFHIEKLSSLGDLTVYKINS